MKILVIVLLFFVNVFSQNDRLNNTSKIIAKSFEKLEQDPANNELQLNYINSIPQNWSVFLSVFQPDDFGQLYDKYSKYLSVLDTLIQNHPDQIGNLLINLSTEAKWEADATGEIQHSLARFAANYTNKFCSILKSHSEKEINNVVEFLADVENYNAYEEFPEIILQLKKLKEISLANKFENAKIFRINSKH